MSRSVMSKSSLVLIPLFLLLLLTGCASTKERVVVQKEVVEVKIRSPEQFRGLCDQPVMMGDTFQDLLILALRQKEAIERCNIVIRNRNDFEDGL